MNNLRYVSVSSLVNELKGLLEGQFRSVSIEGEITNLSLSSSGHYYFTISDKNASLSACLFKMDAMRNPEIRTLKDGDKVQCVGGIGVYAKRGTFQIIVKRITKQGKGDLKEQFEMLKKKLAADGLFDLEVKKEIPKLPKRVAIITALRGAALADFLNIMKRRSHWVDVLVVPTLVQGDTAAQAIRKSLFNTIKYSMQAPEDKKLDVIVLSRGGGSLEDLWCFNDEALAWDIFNCPIPTISAVGHQVDYSICDFVSDLRCETPSAAAQILSEEQSRLISRLENSRRHLVMSSKEIINSRKDTVSLARPDRLLSTVQRNHTRLARRLEKLSLHKREVELLHIHDYWFRLDDLSKRALSSIEKKKENFVNIVEKKHDLLLALNPKNILNRGYSYLSSTDGSVVSSIDEFDDLPNRSVVDIHFHDGKRKVIKE
ncbi:exodeoxyribonuclease VII large subunit [Halobacteriovorax sp. HLS]|uniref:exodeoxyribonuclease VII large subunit n=1 Tax=Halobacteriovorax sp. HLS TaxID=2234000 RepID=UPI000FDAEFE7|nr:exodeoxyribonuclease VII large subunit [Halobacteriovorax sp. HLS]